MCRQPERRPGNILPPLPTVDEGMKVHLSGKVILVYLCKVMSVDVSLLKAIQCVCELVCVCVGKCDLTKQPSVTVNADDGGLCNMVVLYCDSKVCWIHS